MMAESDTRNPRFYCSNHDSEELEDFCQDHQQAICQKCFRYDHGRCLRVEPLTAVASNVKNEKEYRDRKGGIDNIIDDLRKLKHERQNDLERVRRESQAVLDYVDHFERKVFDTIKALKEQLRISVMHKKEEFEGQIQADMKEIEETLNDSVKVKEGMEVENEIHTFLHLKDSKVSTTKGKSVVHRLSNHCGIEAMHFQIHPCFERITRQSTLGELSFEYTNRPDGDFHFQEMIYKAQPFGKLTAIESYMRNISGSCFLPNGSLVLASSDNIVAKLDPSLSNVEATCIVEGEPWGVCSVCSSEIAVTAVAAKAVRILSTDGQMNEVRSFKVDVSCRGILCHAGKFFICCGGGYREEQGHIRVYSIAGTFLMKFSLQEDVTRPKDIALYPDESLIYVTGGKRCIVVFTVDGAFAHVIAHPNLVSARGIAFDDRDQFFVGCMNKNRILQFSREEKFLKVLLPKVPPLSSLCFEASDRKLIITSANNGVNVFVLQEQVPEHCVYIREEKEITGETGD